MWFDKKIIILNAHMHMTINKNIYKAVYKVYNCIIAFNTFELFGLLYKNTAKHGEFFSKKLN